MILRLNMSGDTPIYVQIRNQIVMGIGRGDLKAGEGLPTVRQLAEDIGVNMMTVTKAYTILKNEGYIEIDRRHGAKVNTNLNMNGEFYEKLEDELSLLAAESKIRGMDRKAFLDFCEKVFNSMNSTEIVEGSL